MSNKYDKTSLEAKIYTINISKGEFIQVPGLIENITLPITIDTAAQANCIDFKWFSANKSRFKRIIMQDSTVNLVDVNGKPLNMQGYIHAEIMLGSSSFSVDFILVEGLLVDCILGLPSTQKMGLDILLSENAIKIKEDKIPFLYIPQRENKERSIPLMYKQTHALHLTEDLWLPPGCEALVNCKAGRMPSRNKAQTIMMSRKDIGGFEDISIAAGAGTIVKSQTVVGIANLGKSIKKIPKGTMIGICRLVPDEQVETKPLGDMTDPDKLQTRLIGLINERIGDGPNDETPVSSEYFKEFIKREKLPEDLKIDFKLLTISQLEALGDVLARYKDLFATDAVNPGSVDPSLCEHNIDTGDSKPINQKPRRVSPEQRRIIRTTIDELLKAGIIQPSRSPWSSPVLLVPKDGGTKWRMCVDYRKLNLVTKKEIYAIPRIDDVLDTLGGKIWFTVLDLASGYFQIPMDKASKEKTAFITYEGLFEYNFMSFGLVNAPSTFQRCMDTVLAGLKWNSAQIYLDDTIVASFSFEQHLVDIVAVLSRFEQAGLHLRSAKCHFCCSEIKYLGHLVSRDGVRANPEKVELIANWGIPTTAANLHSFIGLAGYYRKLIKNFASREASLRAVLKNPKAFKMGPIEIDAFKDLQQCLMSDPVLVFPDFTGNSKFKMQTDASDLGISAILVQYGPDGKEGVVQYASRMLTKDELKWHAQEKEALAIVWGCNKFRAYLLGSPFIVETDHHSLQWLFRSEKGRLARWALSLSEFDFTIKHRSGKSNVNADVASRWTKTPPDESWDPFPDYADPLNSHKIMIIKEQVIQEDLRRLIIDAQDLDPKFKKAKIFLRAKNKKAAFEVLPREYLRGSSEVLLEDDAILCRKRKTSHKTQSDIQVIIPQGALSAKNAILKQCHDKVTSGHFGYKRTYHKLQTHYYWPRSMEYCKKYTISCHECQLHKTTAPNAKNKKLKPSLPYAVNARLAIDLIGPLTKTTSGNQYACVIWDYFTKWAMVVPMTDKEAITVADAIFNNWYMIFGLPYEIQTDQGSEFTNDVLKRLNERMSIGHRVSTPYYPQANGAVERFNRTFKGTMAIYSEKHPKNWDWHTTSVVFAYNSSLNPITGFSPFFLMFGREPRLPIDILHSSYKDLKHDVEQYQLEMTMHLRNAHDIVRKRLEEYATRTKMNWDKNVRPYIIFKQGDLVSMYRPSENKLRGAEDHSQVWIADWIGPLEVTKTPYEDNLDVYQVKDLKQGREFTVNAHKLKPYISREYLSSLDSIQRNAPQGVVRSLDVGFYQDRLQDAEVLTDLKSSPMQKPVVAPRPVVSEDPNAGSTRPKRQYRHDTGSTLQEQKRQKQRLLDSKETNEHEMREYEVEKIITHKREKNALKYLVKWKHYDETHNTWEPSSQFGNSHLNIEEYWKTQSKSARPRAYKNVGELKKSRGRDSSN